MISPSQQDITVRLELIGIRFSELANIWANDLKWGRKCNSFEDLFFLNAYLELLECYDLDSDNNCISEDQLAIIFANITKITKQSFPPYGYTYTPS